MAQLPAEVRAEPEQSGFFMGPPGWRDHPRGAGSGKGAFFDFYGTITASVSY